MHLIGVYGAGGFGREVLPMVRDQYIGAAYALIDDARADGRKVISFDSFLESPADAKSMVFAVADSAVRRRLVEKCLDAGLTDFPRLRAHPSVILDNVEIGQGAILCPFTTLTSDIRIGAFFHANAYSYVMHDCVIGDYVTFAPAVKCNGNIVIEDHVYVGAGAVIKQGLPGRPLRIGHGAVIGMGAVVTKDVPPGATMVGNPARRMQPRA